MLLVVNAEEKEKPVASSFPSLYENNSYSSDTIGQRTHKRPTVKFIFFWDMQNKKIVLCTNINVSFTFTFLPLPEKSPE